MGKKTPAYTAATLIENNVTLGNGGRGIQVFLSDNVTIRSNTSANNIKDPKLLGTQFGEIQAVFANNINIYDNIMSPDDARAVGFYAYDAHSVEADYNLTIGSSPTSFSHSSGISWGRHNVIGLRPGFKASGAAGENADFHLTAASDAVGRGDPRQAAPLDFDGISRTPSGPVDVGAYQLVR
jgi:hypothetical protein